MQSLFGFKDKVEKLLAFGDNYSCFVNAHVNMGGGLMATGGML